MKLFCYKKEDIVKTLEIAWPAVMESFFSSFTGLVDSFMVSSLGASAVAAVGLTNQPKFAALSLFFAANVAVSAVVARRKGEQRKDEANRVFSTFIAFCVIASVIISLLVVMLASPIIALCGSEPATHDSAVEYFRIIIGWMFFNVLLMGINAAQRGCGNTKIALRTNLVSNGVNIIMNYLLIGGKFGFPAMGIKGAAIATVLGTVAGCLMSILSVLGKDNYISIPYIIKQKIMPGLDTLLSLFKVGYGVFAEQIMIRIGFMATAVMAANQGTAVMAAHQVSLNVMSLSFAFGDGLQATAVALIGYSLGAQQPEQAKMYGRICRMIGGCISAMLTIIFLFGGRSIYRLFFAEEEIVAVGMDILKILILVVIFQISAVVYMGSLRGAGDTLYTAIVSTISITFVRTFVSWFCCYVLNWGIVGIWIGILADQSGRMVMGSIRFKSGKWMKIKI